MTTPNHTLKQALAGGALRLFLFLLICWIIGAIAIYGFGAK